MKGDRLGMAGGEGGDRAAGRVAVFLRPGVPAGGMAFLDHRLRQGLEQSVQVERPAAGGDIVGEVLRGGRIAGLAEGAEEEGQRLQLERADGGVIDELGLSHLRRDDHFGEHRVGTRHLVQRDVERIEEVPARRRERAELPRIGHEQGVQRVDADEVGAGSRCDLGEAGEVLEVAHPPVAPGAQAVDLAGNPPAAAVPQPIGHEAGDAFRRLHRAGVRRRHAGQAFGDRAIVGGGDAQRLKRRAERRVRRGDDRPHEGEIAALDAGAFDQTVEVVAHFAAFLLLRMTVSPASIIKVRPSSWRISLAG